MALRPLRFPQQFGLLCTRLLELLNLSDGRQDEVVLPYPHPPPMNLAFLEAHLCPPLGIELFRELADKGLLRSKDGVGAEER